MNANSVNALQSFRVWCPDDGDRPTTGPNVRALDEEDAAERWVEAHHADLDYTAECLVMVEDEEGHRFEVTVRAETGVTFSAHSVDA